MTRARRSPQCAKPGCGSEGWTSQATLGARLEHLFEVDGRGSGSRPLRSRRPSPSPAPPRREEDTISVAAAGREPHGSRSGPSSRSSPSRMPTPRRQYIRHAITTAATGTGRWCRAPRGILIGIGITVTRTCTSGTPGAATGKRPGIVGITAAPPVRRRPPSPIGIGTAAARGTFIPSATRAPIIATDPGVQPPGAHAPTCARGASARVATAFPGA